MQFQTQVEDSLVSLAGLVLNQFLTARYHTDFL